MKLLKFVFIFALAVFAAACANDNQGEQLGPPPAPINPNALNNTTSNSTAGAVAGVQHYTCPNNCEGSGGDTQGTCPVCGTAYNHNQAYHSQSTAAQPTTPPPSQPQANSGASATGVFHYTCPNGCAGGAATAQACATCGTMLAHNQAFHAQPAAQPAPQQPATAAPAGVFHYTCPNGCNGGAATAQACATCGTMLAHNQAYHNAAPATGGATAAPGGKSPLYINNN